MTMEEKKCKVCGKEIPLDEVFCPNCKFPYILYPAEIPERVRTYEENRVKYYKALLESPKTDNTPAIKGYLVMKQGERIQNVFPVFVGRNVFGKSPGTTEGDFSNMLTVICDELESKHFMLETTDEGRMKAILLNGKWGLRNKSNDVKEDYIEQGQSIFIGDLQFVFCGR